MSGESEVIDGSVICGIFNGGKPPQGITSVKQDQKGIHVSGARIRGPFDLGGITSTTGLLLTKCQLEEPLVLQDATVHCLVLDNCVLPAVWAERAKVDTLTIQDCQVTAECAGGALRLTDAHVTIDLRLSRTRVTNSAGPAVQASGASVDACAYLDALRATGTGPDGAVNLVGATVGVDLVLRGATLTGGTHPALRGENLTVKGAALLDGGFKARGGGDLGAVCLASASVTRQLSLRGAALTGSRGPALGADLLAVQASLLMDQGFRAMGEGELAAVRLKGAKISGDLRLDGATLANASGPALAADLLSVQGDLTMTGTGSAAGGQPVRELAADEQQADLPNATGVAGRPSVQLRGAIITGRLSLAGATIVSDNPPGHDGPSPSPDSGAVVLSGATISGDLVLEHATLRSAVGPALLADYLTVKGDAFRCEQEKKGENDEDAPVGDQGRKAFRATGEGDLGAVCLVGATISGQVSMRGAILAGSRGPALVADSVTVQGDMILDNRFTASGTGPLATVRLRGATVNGRLVLDDATVTGSRQPGEDAVSPADYKGALYLTGATIGHDLLLRRTRLDAAAGPALRADYLTVKGDAFRCEARDLGCQATGTGPLGAVLLGAATLNGQLSLRGCTLTNTSGPALVADSATIFGDVLLDEGFRATGAVRMVEASVGKELLCLGHARRSEAKAPVLDLGRTQVGALSLSETFALNENGLPYGKDLLSCDGLKYIQRPVLLAGEPPAPTADGRRQVGEWTAYLRDHTVYSAQAYQQLAAAYQAQGDDDTARRILISQRDDAIYRGGLSPLNQFWQRVLALLIGYGYRSVKALYWLAGLFAVTALTAVLWFGPTALIQPVSANTPVTTTSGATSAKASAADSPHCSFTAQLSYAIDVAFPIITISGSSEQQCDVPAEKVSPGQQAVVAFGWLVRALSATLLVIYVAGLTGLTSRTPGS